MTGFGFTTSEDEHEAAEMVAVKIGGKEEPEEEGWGFLDCFFGGFDLPSPGLQRDWEWRTCTGDCCTSSTFALLLDAECSLSESFLFFEVFFRPTSKVVAAAGTSSTV